MWDEITRRGSNEKKEKKEKTRTETERKQNEKKKRKEKKIKIASSSLRFHRIRITLVPSIRVSFVISPYHSVAWYDRSPCKTVVYQSNLSQYRIVYLNVNRDVIRSPLSPITCQGKCTLIRLDLHLNLSLVNRLIWKNYPKFINRTITAASNGITFHFLLNTPR